MKKTISRALSLLLVLVMLVGVMPTVLAASTNADVTVNVTPASGTEILAGSDVILQIPAGPSGSTGYASHSGWTWTVNGTSIGTTESSSTTYTVPASATSLSVSVTGTYTMENGDTIVASGSATATVTKPALNAINVTAANGATSLEVNESLTLTASPDPATAELGAVTWAVTAGNEYATVAPTSDGAATAILTGVAAGNVTVQATAGGKSNTIPLTVTEESVTASAAAVSVKVGTTAKIAVAFDPADAMTGKVPLSTAYSYSGYDTTLIDVAADGTVTGKEVGTTKVTITLPTVEGVTFASGTIECNVTVNAGTISVANKELKFVSTGNVYALENLAPVYDADGDGDSDNDKVTFTYDLFAATGATLGNVTLNSAKTQLTAATPGAAIIVVKAHDKDDSDASHYLAQEVVYVSFYQENIIEVTMPDGNATLTFGTAADIKETGNLSSKILSGYYGTSAYSISHDVDFSGLSSTEGTLNHAGTGNTTQVSDLGLAKFTVGTANKAVFEAKVSSRSFGSVALCKATITINYDGELGDIEYSTTYNQSVTFEEDDFAKFWKASGRESNLDYVTFSLLSYPAYGKLYLTSSSTAATNQATYNHQFYYQYSAYTDYGTYNKDLDTLTYVPEKSLTTTYDVVIPFAAYGTDADDSITGRVVIHMNPKDNAITSRGVFFGTVYDKNGTTTTSDDLTYADQMAEIYNDATGKNLGYVTFSLPAVEKATLFSRIPGNTAGNTLVAQGSKLSSATKLYYDSGSSGVSKLANAAIIPAAGYKGTITLTFTGYDISGNNEKTCSITFTVQTKTASSVFSDVTAKNYSWASDSVDFLYYEGTAQGSNGKYNPAANITRRDFMLMLYRAFLAEDYGTYTVSSNFPDVVKGYDSYSKEIYQAVGVAKYLGIAQGTNNKFNPTANITRQEAMVLIYRTLDVIDKDLEYSSSVRATSFKDYSKIGSWAVTAIADLVSHGVIQGTNDMIKPAANITRAEMAAILHRVITY